METLYWNGPILTMACRSAEEEKSRAPEAVLVRSGRIAALGSYEEMRALAGKRVRTVDLQGRCLMPGFIDAHSHAALNGQMALCCDLSGCTSFEEIIGALRDYAAARKITGRHAIIGFGYDHNFLREAAQPDKRVLDQVSREIPILILHVSAHLACVNSAALHLCGITAETPDPEGGVVGRIPGTREPSGYLEEAGLQLVQQAVYKRLKISLPSMLRGVCAVYLRHGVTTIQDGASTKRDMLLLKALQTLRLLKADVVAYPLMSSGGAEILHGSPKLAGRYRRRLKIGGYKLVLDGSPQGRSAWMSEPYLGGEEGYCGYPWMPDEQVEQYVLQAVREGRQLLAHCNGDAASAQFLRAYRRALEQTGSKADLRPVMIHCQTVRNDQLDEMAQMGMIASVFVGHVWYWGDVHLRNFGPARGHHISPARDALDRGLHINFHQDTPVTRPDMLHSVWCAVNRISRSGQTVGADQRIPVYDALLAVTMGGAYQYFEEDSKGSIEAGKRADLVILDRSPLDAAPEEIRDIRVLETIKDGKTVWRSGKQL